MEAGAPKPAKKPRTDDAVEPMFSHSMPVVFSLMGVIDLHEEDTASRAHTASPLTLSLIHI